MKYFFAAILFAYFVAALTNSSVTPTNKACNVINNSFYAGLNCKKIEQQLEEIRNEIRGLKRKACEAVGVADIKKIPDGRMKASTVYSSSYVPSYGRLNSNRGAQRWCPKTTSDRSDYLQVDMGAARFVCAVATQRRSSEYTKTYYLKFSLNGVTWNIYKENNAQKVFAGSTVHLSVVRVSLNPVIKARFVRFYPITHGAWPCLSVEIYASN